MQFTTLTTALIGLFVTGAFTAPAPMPSWDPKTDGNVYRCGPCKIRSPFPTTSFFLPHAHTDTPATVEGPQPLLCCFDGHWHRWGWGPCDICGGGMCASTADYEDIEGYWGKYRSGTEGVHRPW